MILVTGATGTIGREVVRALTARKIPFRAMTRSLASTEKLKALGAETVPGDFARPSSLAAAFRGVESLFLLSAPGPDMVGQESAAIEAARKAGVQRVVKLSALGASTETASVFPRVHGELEAKLRNSGMVWTMLRPNGFMQNFVNFYAAAIAAGQPLYAAMGEAKVAWVDAHDVGESAAAVLTESGHEERIYELVGPEALTYGESVQVLSTLLGRTVGYVPVSDASASRAMLDMGMEPWRVHAMITLVQLYRTGLAGQVNGNVELLTGHPAGTLAAFFRAHLEAFREAVPSGHR